MKVVRPRRKKKQQARLIEKVLEPIESSDVAVKKKILNSQIFMVEKILANWDPGLFQMEEDRIQLFSKRNIHLQW
jgi:hypothetical protein